MNTHTTPLRLRDRLLGLATLTTVAFGAVGCGTDASTTNSDTPAAAASQGSARVLSTLPADTDILAVLPARNGHDQTKVVVQLGFTPQAPGPCGGEGLDLSDATEVRSAVYTGESEGGMERAVALFSDSQDAQAAVAAVREDVATCDSARIATHLDEGTSPEVLRFVNAYDTGEGFAYELVAAGNVVVYTTTFFQSAQDAAVREETFELLAGDSEELLATVGESLAAS